MMYFRLSSQSRELLAWIGEHSMRQALLGSPMLFSYARSTLGGVMMFPCVLGIPVPVGQVDACDESLIRSGGPVQLELQGTLGQFYSWRW